MPHAIIFLIDNILLGEVSSFGNAVTHLLIIIIWVFLEILPEW